MQNEIYTDKAMPIFVGNHGQYVMGRAKITQTATDSQDRNQQVRIEIVVSGLDARNLGSFLAAPEIVSLSFTGLPAGPSIKENM